MARKIKYGLLALSIFAGIHAVSYAQGRARVSGLEKNTEYTALIAQERALQSQDDSISTALDALREQLRINPQSRTTLGTRILDMESSLFDVRSRKGGVTGRINAIEQDYVLRSLEAGVDPVVRQPSGPQPGTRGGSAAYLVNNEYFRKNLRPDDYALLLETQGMEGSIAGYLSRYRDNYRVLTRMEASYPRERDEARADSIYTRYMESTSRNAAISDSVASTWNHISDNKLYLYSYLLEKQGRSDILNTVHKAVSQQQEIEGRGAGKYSSDDVAFYPLRKSLMLDIEIRMADLAGLQPAKDSLSRVRLAMDTLSYAYEPINMPERLFIDFRPVSVSPGKYGTGRPIPAAEMHERGTIYRIQLGTFQKPAAVSGFRNLYPLSYTKGDDGRYRYFAGCYDNLGGAVEGLETVKRVGFKDAFVVVWEMGTMRTLGQSAPAGAGKGPVALYRLEIETGGKPLPAPVQDMVSNSGKDVSKVGNAIIIGTFDSILDAEKLASEMKEAAPGMGVRTVMVEE